MLPMLNKNTPMFEREFEFVRTIYASGKFQLPIRYICMLSNECNLNCPFCFMDKISTDRQMNLEDWLCLFDQLPNYARVILMGGEPLFYKDFEKVYRVAASRFRCTIVTNGTLLDKKIVDILLSEENLYEVCVSIEMIGNKNRGFTKKQWIQMVDGIKYYVKVKEQANLEPRLGISTIFLYENAVQLFDLYRFCREELGCDNVTYNPLNGTPMQLRDSMGSFKELYSPKRSEGIYYNNWEIIKDQLEKIRCYDLKHGITSTYIRPKLMNFYSNESFDKLDIINAIRDSKHEYGTCKYPWSDCRIYGDGSISPCLAYSFGNFKETPNLVTILTSENASRFKSALLEEGFFPQCYRCIFQYLKEYER
jgi:MoaA/NifB/PqqE/SkfB family radical SAM enzyme